MVFLPISTTTKWTHSAISIQWQGKHLIHNIHETDLNCMDALYISEQENLQCEAHQAYPPLEFAHFGLHSKYFRPLWLSYGILHPLTFQGEKLNKTIKGLLWHILVFNPSKSHHFHPQNRRWTNIPICDVPKTSTHPQLVTGSEWIIIAPAHQKQPALFYMSSHTVPLWASMQQCLFTCIFIKLFLSQITTISLPVSQPMFKNCKL